MIAILFDIDDTLYLERDYVHSGFLAVGAAAKCPEFGEQCWALFLDGVRGNTFDLAREAYPQVTMPTADLVTIYRNHVPAISLCADARRFLEDTRLRTGIVTDGPLPSQRAKFLALGLLPWIECPLFTTEIGTKKPAPAPFQLVARTLDVPYRECAYVADNPAKDFAGPKSLGMQTIRIRRPGALHYDVPSGTDVDREIASFDEIAGDG